MARIARWCVTHRFVVIAVWLLLLIGTAVGSRRLGTEFTNGFTLPGTESTQGPRPARVEQSGRPDGRRHDRLPEHEQPPD